MSNLQKLNQAVDKAQSESEAIQSQGVKKYIVKRKVSMSLALFLGSLFASFLIGVILF